MKQTFLIPCGRCMVALLFLLNACKGPEGAVGPQGSAGPQGAAGSQGPVGPNLTGSLVGFVSLHDQHGRLQTNHSGTRIEVKASSPLIADTTDAAGRFELKGVKTGSYNLLVSKAGYTNYTFAYVQHVGGSAPTLLNDPTFFTYKLYQGPSYGIRNLTVEPATGGVNVKGEFYDESTGTSNQKGVFLFWGDNADVSSAAGKFKARYPVINLFQKNFSVFLTYSLGQANSLTGQKGQILHLIAYPTTFNRASNDADNSDYLPFALGSKVSAIANITLP